MSHELTVVPYSDEHVPAMTAIWNQVVQDGIAFPQEDEFSEEEASAFFASQSACGVAVVDSEAVGLFILHPNNVGRCGHIANASYAVRRDSRGLHVGTRLVETSLAWAGELGFRLLQFNAVVATNASAIHVYENCGFTRIGAVPGGFRLKDGSYSDIILFYHEVGEALRDGASASKPSGNKGAAKPSGNRGASK